MDNASIRAQARALLSGKWTMLVIIWLVYSVVLNIASLIIPGLGGIITLLILGPLSLGLSLILLRVVRNQDVSVEMLFEGFSDYSRSLVTGLLVALYVFLWSLLLIIPGIIAALAYSMSFFILADDPHISAQEAINQSKRMMEGHKMDLFMLQLSFLGWWILCIFTFGIGIIWLGPYISTSTAVFYQSLKAE